MQKTECDYLVIGAGIIGSSIARALAYKTQSRIVVLEKEASFGCHASGRNSGVIHSGINQKPGSLKGEMCVKGSRLLRDYCRKKNVPMQECGTLVIARNERESAALQELWEMGRQCGVEDLRLLTGEELRVREPLALGREALLSPTGAVVDSKKLLEAVIEDARSSGVAFHLCAAALNLDGAEVTAGETCFKARHVINCAGLYADKIAHQAGVGLHYRIVPFRGEYVEVRGCAVNSMIYQPPDLRFPFLSIHLTRETDGRVLAGPTATLAFGREDYDKQYSFLNAKELWLDPAFWKLLLWPDFFQMARRNAHMSCSRHAFFREISRLVRPLSPEQIAPAKSGIRAQMVDQSGNLVNDLLVEKGPHSTHVLNAVSPGMTAALAFADYVLDNYIPH